MHSSGPNAAQSPSPDHYACARRPLSPGDQAYWRACLRLSPALADPTYINDTIRREHSPPHVSHLTAMV